ncbi:hypothetical protein [uncultured Comamonas sp.]|uniref:hypothetical protein n=1 Tax=uncultured Comamonas sp. TaxID=114710 RepID=UPI00259229B0|nr:hypothetical protein [uncultured Comamonas sp.]
MEYKIIQIMPAAGWYVTYKDIEDYFDPVACFALIEEENTQMVVPMTSGDGYLDRADQADNYKELVYLPQYQPPQP